MSRTRLAGFLTPLMTMPGLSRGLNLKLEFLPQTLHFLRASLEDLG